MKLSINKFTQSPKKLLHIDIGATDEIEPMPYSHIHLNAQLARIDIEPLTSCPPSELLDRILE